MKRKVVIIFLSCMIAGSFGGCSMFPSTTTAESLIENMYSKEAKEVDSDIKVVISSKVTQGDVSAGMSIKLDMNLQSNGKAGYTKGKATVKVMGLSKNQELESYYDYEDSTQYVNTNGKWVYKELEGNEGMSSFFTDIDVDKFEDLSMSKTKDGWEVTGKISYKDVADMMLMSDSLEGLGMGDEDSLSSISMDVKFVYAKDKSVKSAEFSIDPKEVKDLDLEEFTVSAVYNEVDKDFSVEIPKDVIRGAVEESDVSSEDGEEDISIKSEIPDTGVELEGIDAVGEDMEDIEGTELDEAEDGAGSGDTSSSFSGSVACQYKGTDLSYESLVRDGWEANSDDGIFVAFTNSKYPDVTLYVYGQYDTVSEEDLKTSGITGYEIDVTYCGDGDYPNVDFGGVSWGSSVGDIKAVYGEPIGSDEYGDYSVYRYSLLDGSELEFTVYSENEFGFTGLTRVSSVNYGVLKSR